jgi:hypothetical protein
MPASSAKATAGVTASVGTVSKKSFEQEAKVKMKITNGKFIIFRIIIYYFKIVH